MKATDMLVIASQIVASDRANSHGDIHESMKMLSAIWSAYLGVKITSEDACNMMVHLKQVRAKTGKKVADHYIDAAGYAALAGQVKDDL